jgi:transposase-like protein
MVRGMSNYPRTLLGFQHLFPDEAACARHLERIRWPDGFKCPSCGQLGEPWRLQARPRVLECRQCGQQVSLTAGTIMHRTRQPLPLWFWAVYLVTTQTPGMSALQFQKQLGIKRYETAFLMLHKLRAAMVRPGRDRIGAKWPVEIDETYVGGKTKGEGRGRHHKTLVVGMVEVLPRKKALGPDPNLPSGQRPQHQGGHGRSFIAGRLRLQVIPNRRQETLEPVVLANVQKNAEVRTDAWTGYDNLHKLGYRHTAEPLRGDQGKTDQDLPMIHIVFGNLDAWLLGTHHGVSTAHLQGYLNEFVFRFNRRFWPMVGFDSALQIAVRVDSLTYRDFYESGQKRRNPAEASEPVSTG